MKKDIFDDSKKDLTISTHWTIKKSIVQKIKETAKNKNMSESKVVSTILENFFNNQ